MLLKIHWPSKELLRVFHSLFFYFLFIYFCTKAPQTLVSFTLLYSGVKGMLGADKAQLKVKPNQSRAKEGNSALSVFPHGFGFTQVITRGL